MLNSLGLGIVFTASDFASTVIKRLALNFLELDNTSQKVFGAIADKLEMSAFRVEKAFKQMAAGAAIASAGLIGLKMVFSGPVSKAAELEDLMLQIQQKTALADREIENLQQSFMKMASTLPLSSEELAKVGIIAGQLGLKAPKDILKLAEVSSKLAATTKNLTEEGAATALARMSILFGVGVDQVERMASSFERLENTTTASAASVFEITKRFAGFAKTLGMTFAESAAFSATLVDVGLNSEEAGSSMLNILGRMTERTALFAKQMNMSDADFKKLFDEDASNAVLTFFKSFGSMDKFAIKTKLKELGLGNVRVAKAVTNMSRAIEGLERNLATSTKAFKENTALQDAYDKLTKSLTKKLQTLKGSLSDLAKSIGMILLPAVKAVVDVFIRIAGWLQDLPKWVKVFATWTFVIASLAATFIGLKMIIVAAIPFIKILLGMIGAGVFIAFGKAILVIGAVVGALVAMKAAWETNFGGIRDLVLPVINKIYLGLRAIGALIANGEIGSPLAEALLMSGNEGVFGFVQMISRVIALAKAMWAGFAEATTFMFQGVGDDFGYMFKEMKLMAVEVWSLVADLADLMATALGMDSVGLDTINIMKVIGAAIAIYVFGPLRLTIKVVTALVGWMTSGFRAVVGILRLVVAALVPYAKILGFIFGLIKTVGIFAMKNLYRFLRLIASVFGVDLDSAISSIGSGISWLVDLLKGAWTSILDFFSNIGRAFKIGMAKHLNWLIGNINSMIAILAKAARWNPLATQSEREADYKRIMDLQITKVQMPDAAEEGGGTGGPGGPSAPGVPSSITIPMVTPGGYGGSGASRVSREEVAEIVRAITREGLGELLNRPVEVRAEVTMDAKKVGMVQNQRRREQALRSGEPLPSFREE